MPTITGQGIVIGGGTAVTAGGIALSDGNIIIGTSSGNGSSKAFLIQTGTQSLAGTTNAFGTTSIDINISAGELDANSCLKIILSATGNATSTIQYSIDLTNTTSNPTGNTFNLVNTIGELGISQITILQNSQSNGSVIIDHYRSYQTTPALLGDVSDLEGLSSGDANIFTTDFTIKINLKFSLATGAARTIGYKVVAL